MQMNPIYSLAMVIALTALTACGGSANDASDEETLPAETTSQAAVTPRDLSAALPATPRDAPAPRTLPEIMSLYTFDCGTIAISDLDGFSTAGDYKDKSDEFSNTCYLIRHPDGDLLWDVGLPAAIKGPDPTVNDVFTLTVDETVEEQLALIGLSPTDIEYVSVSHSHFDHTGQPEAAGNATWLVHAREYQAMFADPQTAQSYAGFAGFDRQEFTGDYDVFGDGSVMILEMPGHTPGHTALQIMLPDNGPVLLTGDLYHRKESRALKRVPRFNTDEAKTRQSMVRFEQLAETLDAFVIIQHEPDDVDQLPTVPDALN